MSKRAEEAALNAYPPTHPEGKRHAKRVQSESVDTHQPIRTIFQKGYELAEKDLALTWGDMQKIHEIICGMDAELESLPYGLGYQEYWKEVLRRYNEWREEQK